MYRVNFFCLTIVSSNKSIWGPHDYTSAGRPRLRVTPAASKPFCKSKTNVMSNHYVSFVLKKVVMQKH